MRIGVPEYRRNSTTLKHEIIGLMRRIIPPLLIILLIVTCNESGWVILENKSDFEKNFDTPQGTVLCLEDAYRSKDIERIVSCKDFRLERCAGIPRAEQGQPHR